MGIIMMSIRILLLISLCLTCVGCDSRPSDDSQSNQAKKTAGKSIAVQYTGGDEEVSQFIKAKSDPVQSDKPYVKVSLVRSVFTGDGRVWDFYIPQARIVGHVDYIHNDSTLLLDEYMSEIPYKRIERDFHALLAHLEIQDAEILWRARLELAKKAQNQP